MAVDMAPRRRPAKMESTEPKNELQTPKTCPVHQRLNKDAMPGWLKFVLLALAIAGFVLTIYFLRY
jgi:hypothetical protein